MIALGVLVCLYAVMSYVWPLLGKQLVLLLWLERLSTAAQWGVRGGLLVAGLALVVVGVRARHRRRGG